MFFETDVVRLKEDNIDLGVKRSFIGAVVDVIGEGVAYTVEFLNENDETVEAALFTEFSANDLELVSRG